MGGEQQYDTELHLNRRSLHILRAGPAAANRDRGGAMKSLSKLGVY